MPAGVQNPAAMDLLADSWLPNAKNGHTHPHQAAPALHPAGAGPPAATSGAPRAGLRGPLTLITAPAGFGKTTLVASWFAGCGMPIAWLSLDKNDNQADRFLTYLVAAVQEADPSTGSEAAQLLAAARPAPAEAVLTSLINGLEARRRRVGPGTG